MFITLPSYPPRAQARSWVHDPASPRLLPANSFSTSSSSNATSSSSRRSAQRAATGRQMLALVDPLSSQRTDNWFGSRKSPSHSDDQLQQMLDDILPAGPNIQDLCDDVLDKAWSGAQQLTAACLAPALPVNSAAVSDHEAAMVAISRALSQTLLHHGGAGDIFDSIQAPQVDALPSWAGVACGNLPEMSVQEFRSLAAEFLDIGGTAAEGRRSNDAPANNAAQSWPAESAGYTANAMRTLSADLMDAYQAWEAQSGEASDALSAQPSFLCTLDRAPAGRGSVEVDSAAVSMDYVSDSGQLSGSSETSDARSGSLQQAQPDLAAQCVAASAAAYSAAPAAAPGQILNSNLQHGGVVRPGSGSAPGGDTPRGGHRQGGRISADPQSRLERNRKLQKDYVQRKRARIDVTHSLADSLRSRVASLTADIGALQKKQDELLSAQTHQVVSGIRHDSGRALQGAEVDLQDPATGTTVDWTWVVAQMNIAAAQRTALVQLHSQTTAELGMLTQTRAQSAQTVKVAITSALSCQSLCTDLLSNTETVRKLQCNLEVESKLKESFLGACRQVLTGEQLQKLQNLVSPAPIDMQALCTALASNKRSVL